MRKVFQPVLVALIFLLAHCTSTKKAVPGMYLNNEKLNGRSFHKLFVEVQTVDVQLRSLLETNLVEALASQGFEGVKSLDVIPFSLKELKLPTLEEINRKVKESGCDGVLFISLSRQGETVEFTPGTERKGNEQVGAGLLAGALNKGQAVNAIPPVYTQGSFSHSGADFLLQSSLYDVPATALIFSVQSGGIKVASIEKTGKTYAADLVAQLVREKLLKR